MKKKKRYLVTLMLAAGLASISISGFAEGFDDYNGCVAECAELAVTASDNDTSAEEQVYFEACEAGCRELYISRKPLRE